MRSNISLRHVRHIAIALVTTTALAACDDDPTEPEPEPEVSAVRLTVGTNSVTVSTTSSPTLNVAAGANPVTAQWLRADGSVESLVTSEEFELRIAPVGNSSLTWSNPTAFGGTLTATGLSGGQTATASVVLFHKVEQHEDFGPVNFTVRVP